MSTDKRSRRADFLCFGSADGQDEGISLNQLACVVVLRHTAEGESYLTRREGQSAPTGKTRKEKSDKMSVKSPIVLGKIAAWQRLSRSMTVHWCDFSPLPHLESGVHFCTQSCWNKQSGWCNTTYIFFICTGTDFPFLSSSVACSVWDKTVKCHSLCSADTPDKHTPWA